MLHIANIEALQYFVKRVVLCILFQVSLMPFQGIANANTEIINPQFNAHYQPQSALNVGDIAPLLLEQDISPEIKFDKAGLISDSKYFFLYQAVFTGFLYIAPQSISNWSDEQKEKDRFESWRDNVSKVVWDEDKFSVNYIGHPYFGAAYYIRARERGYDRQSSFWYSTAMSTAYEFGIEAMFEHPSIQDLIVTPVLGSALGYYFESLRADVKRKKARNGMYSTGDKFLLNITDPLGYLNDIVRGWFKSDVEVVVTPFFKVADQKQVVPHTATIGMLLNIRW
mgnify:CR=1 FL=1